MPIENPIQELYSSATEQAVRDELLVQLRECPIPEQSLLPNLGLFLNSKNLARILMMDTLYRQIVNIHGVVIEFGTRWGQNLSLFTVLRGIYEPFNRHRKIIGFDTFEGFPEIGKEDKQDTPFAYVGGLTTTPGYETYLNRILSLHERDNPMSHVKKYELVKGDANTTVHQYFERSPETLVALAYFDFDIYRPTLTCLESIWPRCGRGTVIAFDELCDHDYPGETLAFLTFLRDRGRVQLRRSPYASRISYFVVE